MFFDNYCTKVENLSEKKVPNFKRKNLAKRERQEGRKDRGEHGSIQELR
jgi:hypothetical protein